MPTDMRRLIKACVFVMLPLIFFTSCSSNSANKEEVRQACDLMTQIHETFTKTDYGAADPNKHALYLQATKKFKEISQNETDKDWKRVFQVYSESIGRYSSGVYWYDSGITQVWFFCGPTYKINSRNYPDQAVMKKYVEDYLGIDRVNDSQNEDTPLNQTSFDWTPIILLGIVVLYLIGTYWIARTAKRAGRSFVGWFLLGLFIMPIAGIIVLTFKPENVEVGSLRRCPHCAEEIQQLAKICRYCNREV